MSLTESDAWQVPAGMPEPGSLGDRTPPQDMAAEQSVLGAMMISKDAIADVAEVLRGADFYRPSHEMIHDAIIDLYGRGEPADMVTVANELQRQGELQRVGGAPYLHTITSSVPIAANASYYAGIVREKAILRRLVDAGTRIVQFGYAGEGDVDDLVDQAQAEVYQVTDKRNSEDYAPLSDIMDGVLDEIEAIGNRDAGLYGVPTGFADLDDLTNGLHAGQMIIVAARPAVGKSTIALDLCRAASIHNNLTSVFFSLEMTKSEITMRLLSAEAKVPLNHIRNGQLSEDDWTKLARKMGEVSSAPVFIDDSPNMTMMEIRAKARRLKQRHDLRLVVIDYMQLMTSGKKVESRQLEVSEFSRQIKLLAKELEVPIIALSQLNRGPEQRSDKRPMLSDLREIRLPRAGRGHGDPPAPRGPLRARVDPARRGRSDRRQAPQRPDPRHHRRLPGPLLALRRHGALTVPQRRQRSMADLATCHATTAPAPTTRLRATIIRTSALSSTAPMTLTMSGSSTARSRHTRMSVAATANRGSNQPTARKTTVRMLTAVTSTVVVVGGGRLAATRPAASTPAAVAAAPPGHARASNRRPTATAPSTTNANGCGAPSSPVRSTATKASTIAVVRRPPAMATATRVVTPVSARSCGAVVHDHNALAIARINAPTRTPWRISSVRLSEAPLRLADRRAKPTRLPISSPRSTRRPRTASSSTVASRSSWRADPAPGSLRAVQRSTVPLFTWPVLLAAWIGRPRRSPGVGRSRPAAADGPCRSA